MSTHAGDTPRRIDVLIINDDRETPSLLNPISGQIFITNTVGKQVIELADGRLKAGEIADQIIQRYRGASPEAIQQEVLAFLEASSTKGLITWTQA